jgi:hypothetical protein
MRMFEGGILWGIINEKNDLRSPRQRIASSRGPARHILWASCNGRAKSVREGHTPARRGKSRATSCRSRRDSRVHFAPEVPDISQAESDVTAMDAAVSRGAQNRLDAENAPSDSRR